MTKVSLFLVAVITAIATESYSLAMVYSPLGFLGNTRTYQWLPFIIVLVAVCISYVVVSRYTTKIVFNWGNFLYYYCIPYILSTVIVSKYTLSWYMVN